LVTISAPASGTLIDWAVEPGKAVAAGEKLGTIQVPPKPELEQKQPVNIDIVAPTACTIVQQTIVKNTLVGAGTSLAYAFNIDQLWITANIKETDIGDVKTGQDVDIIVDAAEGNTLTGKVNSIGLTTAGTFSLLPSSNTTGNYTKVTQVIPVKISLDGYKGLYLVPGMNVTIRIHK
jgi:multidrug resistance efflux pump